MGDKWKVDGCKKYNFCKRLIINKINVLWREWKVAECEHWKILKNAEMAYWRVIDGKSGIPISLFLLSFSAFLSYNLIISNKSYNFAVEFQKSGK